MSAVGTSAGLLTTAEVCAHLGCSARTWWRLVSQYRVRPVRAGRARWRLADVDRVIEARQRARR
jgi:excisionase family DNA binding protein